MSAGYRMRCRSDPLTMLAQSGEGVRWILDEPSPGGPHALQKLVALEGGADLRAADRLMGPGYVFVA